LRLGLALPYGGQLSFPESLELTRRAEALGFDSVWVPEAWGFDAVSILGALAVRTERIKLGTGIVNVYSRTPALIGQTAATLDALSGGRFILGLGTSGHQVIAGWHGIPFDRPLLRVRETVTIVSQVLRRQPVSFRGEVFQLEKGLKLLAHPVRDRVPIYLATITPAGTRLAAEVGDGWMPIVWSPAHAGVFQRDLEAGLAAGGRPASALEVAPTMPVLVDADLAAAYDALRPWVALYVGGMGSRSKNFYTETIRRYGFEAEAIQIQDLYLGGRKRDAIAAVPDALVDAITLVGPPTRIRERLQACAEAGATLVIVHVEAANAQAARLLALEKLAEAA
jgi:F420-dependent oxidoreductase-like protein